MSNSNISLNLFGHSFEPDNLKSQVSKLQALLEDENFTLDTECLLQTLEQCFLICTAESLDEQIFKQILPKAHHLLSQVVKAIDERTSNNEKVNNLNDVKHKLHFCHGLLIFWQKCVEGISAFKKIRALYVTSLCSILPETIKIIFDHCKDRIRQIVQFFWRRNTSLQSLIKLREGEIINSKSDKSLITQMSRRRAEYVLRTFFVLRTFLGYPWEILCSPGCFLNPKTYGTLLSGVMQELKNLFSRASAILKLFFATLDGVIVFDTDVESETELLTKVVDAYGSIACIANGMDTKTYIEISEAFAKLAIDYQNDIKCASPSSITMHLAQMTKDASCLLSTIKDRSDKNIERTRVATIYLLKTVEKLTAFYSTFLTYEMLLCLIALLTEMHGHSYLNLLTKDGGRISVNPASFLDIIFDHDNFKQAYCEYGRKIDVYQLNYHLLTITIMKKLNNMSYEHHYRWFVGMDSILDIAFTHIEHLQEEIIARELRLPGNYEIGERPRLGDIYETTLVPMCNLISQIPSEAFHTLELLLLKHLLSGRFWSSLLSSDVWCFIGRFSTSQLCIDHVKYLIRVSVTLAERRNTVEVIILDNMIGRLYELLNENEKYILFDDLAFDTNYNTSTLYWPMAKMKGSRPEHSIHKSDNLPRIFLDLQEHPTTHNWKRLMQHISTMQAADYSDNKIIGDALVEIWNFSADAIAECEGKQLDALSDFVVILFDGTCLDNLQNEVLDSILMSIAVLYIYMPPQVKIKLCQYLRQNVENLDRCGSQSISALTKLYSRLLEDVSPWVHQEALESFERIGHTCSERLVAGIAKGLAKIPIISNVMQAYLSGTPHYVLKGFSNAYGYLEYVCKAAQDRCKHTCCEHEESLRKEKIPRLEEENSQDIIPLLLQLDEQAEKMYKGLTEAFEGRANISETVCRKLITILEKILNASKK